MGLCLGLTFAAKQYSKPLLAWVAGTTLLLALVLMGLEMHSHYLTAQAHRAQQAQTDNVGAFDFMINENARSPLKESGRFCLSWSN